jgi:hypothetical protein
LGVLCIATQHAYLQSVPFRVVAEVFGGADVLLRRRPQVAHLDPERGDCVADLRGRRHPRRRAERQPCDCAGGQAEGQASQRSGGERSAEHDGTERCERHEPRGEHTDRANELRPDNDDDRGRSGEPELRIAPTRQQMRLEREPIGLDDLTQNDCRADDAQCRDEQITHQVPTPAQHHVDDQHDRKPEHAEERRPPKGTGPPEHSRQRLRDVSVLSGRRRRDHCRQPDDDRREEQKGRVDRSPVAASRLGLRQQHDAPGTFGRRRRLVPTRACRRRQDSTVRDGAGQMIPLITTARREHTQVVVSF